MYLASSKSSTEPIALDQVDEEADRLLEHRLAQLVVEAREPLAIDAVVLLEAAEVEPVAAELRGQAADAVVAQHAPGLRDEHLRLVQVAGGGMGQQLLRRACSTRGSSSAGWPGRSPTAAALPSPGSARSTR